MSNLKICNLDVIAPVQKRELVLSGKTYEVLPLSVERFIDLQMKRQEMVQSTDLAKTFEIAKSMIKVAIPTLEDNVFSLLTMEQMSYLTDFILDNLPDDKLVSESEKKAEPEKAKPEKDEAEAGK